MTTYSSSWPRPRRRRGRSSARSAPRSPTSGCGTGHDRRQRLLERPHQPPAAATGCDRRTDDGRRGGRRRDYHAEEFFLGVYLTAAGPASCSLGYDSCREEGRLRTVTLGAEDRIANAAAWSTALFASPSAASTRCRCSSRPTPEWPKRCAGEPDAPVRRHASSGTGLPRRGARDARCRGCRRPLMDVSVTVNGTTYERASSRASC
jgi:hypothetical protein